MFSQTPSVMKMLRKNPKRETKNNICVWLLGCFVVVVVFGGVFTFFCCRRLLNCFRFYYSRTLVFVKDTRNILFFVFVSGFFYIYTEVKINRLKINGLLRDSWFHMKNFGPQNFWLHFSKKKKYPWNCCCTVDSVIMTMSSQEKKNLVRKILPNKIHKKKKRH